MWLWILFFFILVKMVLMFVNGCRVIFGIILFLVVNWKVLVKFWCVLISELIILILFSIRCGIFRFIDFGGRLIVIIWLFVWIVLIVELNVVLVIVVIIVAWALLVFFCIILVVFLVCELIVKFVFILVVSFNCLLLILMVIILVLKIFFVYCRVRLFRLLRL